jgi:hypothetical protein
MIGGTCIDAFRETVRLHAGEWWAAESVLPCPKEELFAALVAAREALYRVDITAHRDHLALIAELTLFIPDDDLAAMQPFLNARGRITGRSFDDPARVRGQAKAYAVYKRLIAKRVSAIPWLEASDGGLHSPIGSQYHAIHYTPTPY